LISTTINNLLLLFKTDIYYMPLMPPGTDMYPESWTHIYMN
jgi:hypothetical protein